jgi:phosphonate transport system substrate-binding protein
MEESMPAAAETPARVGVDHARAARERRRLGVLLLLSFPALALAQPVKSALHNSGPIRIGTTAVILEDQVSFLDDWRRYLEQHLHGRAVFVQRGSYREITALINNDELDFAWVCGYPYVANRATMRLLAMPLYHNKPLYQSYLIVPRSDAVTRGYADLEGKIFAYSDPNSNSGFLVPQYLMLRAGLDPQTLFHKSFFTYAHRKVVSAVAAGVADGGSVDGYVWETLALVSPDLTAKTRVALKSPEFGFPPLVARASMSPRDFIAMQDVLVGMSADEQGKALLRRLNLDGFARDDPRVFDGIVQALAYVAARERLPQ